MAVFDLHAPWLFVFGVFGNIISIFVYLSPLPTFIRIHKAKSTMGFQSVPYVVALFSAMLWMYYAFLKKNTLLLVSINSFGCLIETIYISVFLLYASKEAKRQTVKLLVSLIGGLYSIIFLATLFPLNGVLRVQVVGWICVAVSVVVFAAPLSIVFQVVRTKSVEFMPFALSFFLTLSAVMWFGYGLLQKDLCIALPNVLGFFLGLIQMLLYGMYRNVKTTEVLEKNKVPEHVINVVALVNSEQIHPIDTEKSENMIMKKVDEEKAADHEFQEERVPETVVVSPPALPQLPENEERSGSELAQVNFQQQFQTPVLVVCAAA